MSSQAISPAITVTDAAALALGKLLISDGNLNKKVRISIKGGGCSGYSYECLFDENIEPDDEVIECDLILEDLLETSSTSTKTKLKVIVDPMCLTLLRGTKIDYVETAKGPELIFQNPNAKTTCGCGSSFSA